MLSMGVLNHTSVFKRLIVIFAISSSFPVYADSVSTPNSAPSDMYFIVTGYYSPVKWQDSYITWSYKGDTRLNGNGTNSASGDEIFTWVLAAPKWYDFGTKIYFENYGIGVVEDRGGAIVEKWVRGHEFDRIDVWMGIGDAWRIRAINWWVRKIKGKVVWVDEEPTLKLTEGMKDTLDMRVGPDSTKEEIEKLQSFLKQIGEYKGPFSGKYSDIEKPLIDFQIKIGVVKNKDDWGAGYFGPKTSDKIKMKYGYGIGLTEEPVVLADENKTQLIALIHKLHLKLEKIWDERHRKKATEELLEEIDKILKTSANNRLNLKLQFVKENF